MRLALTTATGTFAQVALAVADAGGDLGAIDIVRASDRVLWRDVTVAASDSEHAQRIVDAVALLDGVTVESVSDRTFLLHLGGKLEIAARVPLNTRDDLSMIYTPGVARVCQAIADDPSRAWNLTIKRHTVAIVSDGSRVLGLGDIGPAAAMPVMEGKALLFKKLANVDAWPVCIDVHSVEEIVKFVVALAPAYGGINLEDIRSPECFEIEERLTELLDIPVFHDDRHGTAVAVLAALTNALQLVGKDLARARIVLVGAGAAGVGVAHLLVAAGAQDLVVYDRAGPIHAGRDASLKHIAWLVEHTNPRNVTAAVEHGLDGADVVIGLSSPGSIPAAGVARMAQDAIVFALANPTPEILPSELPANVRVMATGRSDFPNQVNNALVFPGLFRGALDVHARRIDDDMKIAAAQAIARMVEPDQLHEEYIIPTPLNPAIGRQVAGAVAQAAHASGASRRPPTEAQTLTVPGRSIFAEADQDAGAT